MLWFTVAILGIHIYLAVQDRRLLSQLGGNAPINRLGFLPTSEMAPKNTCQMVSLKWHTEQVVHVVS